MIRIALVEDEAEVRAQLQGYVQRHTRQYGTEFAVTEFADGMELLDDYRPVYDILFLDVEMKHLDGISVFAHDINHIHRDDHRDTQLQQLCGKVKIALHVGAVQNVDDRIRFFFHQKSASETVFRRKGCKPDPNPVSSP